MAVTVTATVRTSNGSERISRNLGLAIVELSLTGTYVTGGFAYDVDAFFRTQATGNCLFFVQSGETLATNGNGLIARHDRANNYIKLYSSLTNDSELWSGTELGTTGLSVTKLVFLAIGYNA